MRIAGIDYSTNAIDIVQIDAYDHWQPTWDRYPLAGSDAFDRTRLVPNVMPRRGSTYWDEIIAIGIEEPRGRNTAPIHRVQGAILACIPDRALVYPWNPTAWRKACGLSGRASKDDVALFTYGELTWSRWPQDAADAYCIALATRTLLQAQAA